MASDEVFAGAATAVGKCSIGDGLRWIREVSVIGKAAFWAFEKWGFRHIYG